jgi:hypothetical protein
METRLERSRDRSAFGASVSPVENLACILGCAYVKVFEAALTE